MNSQMTMESFLPDGVNGGAATLAIVALLSMLFQQPNAAENDPLVVRLETLLRSTTSWDGEPQGSLKSGHIGSAENRPLSLPKIPYSPWLKSYRQTN